MGFLSSIIFLIIAIATFAIFFLNLKAIWSRFLLGKGEEDVRTDNAGERVMGVFTGAILHNKMFKDFKPGVMHAMIFGGFLFIMLGTLETLINGVFHSFTYQIFLGDGFFYGLFLLTQDLANFIVVVAIVWGYARRIMFPPKRLQGIEASAKKDAYIVLGLILGLTATALIYMGGKPAYDDYFLPFSSLFAGILGVGASGSVFFWWVHCLILFGFMVFLPYSKHQHLIWLWPGMFARNLKSRGRIKPMTIDEEAESFGIGKLEEFSWKHLLDSYTCVECGRCSDQCPAHNTGKPLDPRKMFHHIKVALNDAVDNPEEDKRKPIHDDAAIPAEELWSCTTCGACMEACPMSLEHIPPIIGLRRYLSLTEGVFPEELNNTYKALENSGAPWAMDASTRADWAKGLEVTTMAEKQDVEYLYWVGCAGSYDDRSIKVSKALVKILKAAGVSFSILGAEEMCNGDTARRLGNEYLAQMQVEANIEVLKQYNVKKIITACPHCFNTFQNEYPDAGFEAKVIHHSEFISDLIKQGKIKPGSVPSELSSITYHDSCYLGRHNEIYDAPRSALKSIGGVNLKEMNRTGTKGFCCGAGGGRMWLEELIGTRINEDRAKEAVTTGCNVVSTACPFCLTMLEDGVKEVEGATIKVKDIAEVVADSLD